MRQGFHSRHRARFRRAAAASDLARAIGAPVDEASELLGSAGAGRAPVDRRALLKGAAAVAGTAALGRAGRRGRRSGEPPRIVIVGAGLAGLRCADVLWNERGLASTVYEWDDTPGGRVATYRDVFANGQIIEEHGEFISSEHSAMLGLVHRFGLRLDDTDRYPPGLQDTFWIDGSAYTQRQLDEDWHAFGRDLFRRTARTAPWPTDYRRHTRDAVAIDRTSVTEWVGANVPGGTASAFGRLCLLDVESEYGGDPDLQSALNLVYLLAYDDSAASDRQPVGSPVLAGTDEKWHVHGGNDQVVTGLVESLPPGTVQTGYRLVAVRTRHDATATCTFDVGGSLVDVHCDEVVLALPFSTLRQVDLTRARLSPLKRTAIAQLQLGTNAKVALQVAGSPWQADGSTGNLFTDDAAVGGWDITNYQPASTSVFLDYLGGVAGSQLAPTYGLGPDDTGTPPDALVAGFLSALEPAFPGMTAAWEAGPKIAWYADGNIDPHILGAYSQYQVGQYTSFGGIEGVPEGNLHFAGEHTSPDFQGFMEGAVRSGERAAGEL